MEVKGFAKVSNDQPAQIINNVKLTVDRNVMPYLPNRDALRRIKRVKRKHAPAEPKSLRF